MASARKADSSGKPRGPFPDAAQLISINLDPTSVCNYACPHCVDEGILNKGIYEHSVLIQSLENLIENGLRSVILIGGGEPVLYPHFKELVSFLKSADIQVGIVSNGSQGKRIMEIAPMLRSPDWIRYSLDNAYNESFRLMHQPKGKNPITLDEICAWVPKIKGVNQGIRFGYSFIISPPGAKQQSGNGHVQVASNVEEIVPAASRAFESGFDYISYKMYLERSEEGTEVRTDSVRALLEEVSQKITQARSMETAQFKVLVSTNLRELLAGTEDRLTRQPRQCHFQWVHQALNPNKEVGIANCPATRGLKAARVGPSDGYATPVRFYAARQRVADLSVAFAANEICKETVCPYNDANWFLDSLIDQIATGQMTLEDLQQMKLPETGDYFF